MIPSQIEQLERLQKLRTENVLTDAEFDAAKERVLSQQHVNPRRLWLGFGAVAAGLLATAGFAFWLAPGTRPATKVAANPSAAPSSSPIPKPPERPASVRLADAFEAATGHRTKFSIETRDGRTTTSPIRILELPFGPALLTKSEIKDGCHACTGAIGVYYLDETDGLTTVRGRWPRAIEGWGWGAAPNEWHLSTAFTANPAIYAEGGFMGQVIIITSATITELNPDGPATSDVIGISYSDAGAFGDDDPDRSHCELTGKIGNIRKGQSFDVITTGSRRRTDHYVMRDGHFRSASKPVWSMPCG